MSYRSEEFVRQVLLRASEAGRGMGRIITHTSALRAAEMQIQSPELLPVQTDVPGTLAVLALPPPQITIQGGAAGPGGLGFLPGYSAPAGSSAAVPDATGRGGDSLFYLTAHASGGSSATAALQILCPLTATAFGGSTATAALVIG